MYKLIYLVLLLLSIFYNQSNIKSSLKNKKIYRENFTFFNCNDIFPELTYIHKDRKLILKEIHSILKNPKDWNYWPEKDLYNGTPNSDWKIFPYYAFGVWVQENCNKTPIITKFIKSIPNVQLATLSKLSPGMKLKPHRGWGNHSNNVLRCHYGLIIPKNMSCYVMVENEIHYHKNDEWLIFDDSKTHMAENRSTKDRIVLIIDLKRPDSIPPGNSDIGDTKELLEIVNYFKNKNIHIS